jgi:[ribosomal protein S18]-alanine N-acetyltransferase
MSTQDIDAVLRVENLCYPNPWSREIFERELRADWSNLVVIDPEDESGQTIGHICYWVVHDELHILNVSVDPDHRRKGLARQMLTVALEVCTEQRLQYVTLEVRVSNTAAITLYESLGFRSIGRRKNYYSDNREDALVLALVLGDDPLDQEA